MPDPKPCGGAHRDVKKHNKALHDAGHPRRESNHVPPKSVYAGTPYAGTGEDDMPAHSILYEDHRVSKGAAGDGATSTGSSSISVQYRSNVKQHMLNGEFYKAMIEDINDLKNTHGIDRSFYNVGLKDAADHARAIGLIATDDQLEWVKNKIDGFF